MPNQTRSLFRTAVLCDTYVSTQRGKCNALRFSQYAAVVHCKASCAEDLCRCCSFVLFSGRRSLSRCLVPAGSFRPHLVYLTLCILCTLRCASCVSCVPSCCRALDQAFGLEGVGSCGGEGDAEEDRFEMLEVRTRVGLVCGSWFTGTFGETTPFPSPHHSSRWVRR